MKLKTLVVSLLCFALLFSVVPALGANSSSLSINGFGTLGLAHASSAEVEFVRDLSQPKGIKDGRWSGRVDSVLGIQANWQLTSKLEAVGQLASRYQYNRSRDPTVHWAFLKWVPDERVALRAGRIGSDLMMQADSRLVGYSYLTVRPSVDFFGPLFFSYFDGLDASLTWPVGHGLLRSKLFAGVIPEKVPGAVGVWDTSGSPLYGLVVDYFIDDWQFRASSTSVRFARDLDFIELTEPLYAAAEAGFGLAKNAADRLATKNTRSYYHSLGLVYDKGPLQLQAAANKITHKTATFQDSYAGYLLAAYRINKVTPYLGVSRWKTTYKNYTTGLPNTSADLVTLNQAYQVIMDASSANQTTYTLGVRWDLLPKIALKLQWDAIDAKGNARFPYANANNQKKWSGRTDVTTATLDFIF